MADPFPGMVGIRYKVLIRAELFGVVLDWAYLSAVNTNSLLSGVASWSE
jgi:hypothetical protein